MGKWRTYRNRGSVSAPSTPGACVGPAPTDYAVTWDDMTSGGQIDSVTNPTPLYTQWDLEVRLDGGVVGDQDDNPFLTGVTFGDSGWSGHHVDLYVRWHGGTCPATDWVFIDGHDFP